MVPPHDNYIIKPVEFYSLIHNVGRNDELQSEGVLTLDAGSTNVHSMPGVPEGMDEGETETVTYFWNTSSLVWEVDTGVLQSLPTQATVDIVANVLDTIGNVMTSRILQPTITSHRA